MSEPAALETTLLAMQESLTRLLRESDARRDAHWARFDARMDRLDEQLADLRLRSDRRYAEVNDGHADLARAVEALRIEAVTRLQDTEARLAGHDDQLAQLASRLKALEAVVIDPLTAQQLNAIEEIE